MSGPAKHSYARLMADAAFHARNARRALEQAQGRAPEAERPWMDSAIVAAEKLRAGALRRGRHAAARGGVRPNEPAGAHRR